jgi:hypothetical protein
MNLEKKSFKKQPFFGFFIYKIPLTQCKESGNVFGNVAFFKWFLPNSSC